MDPTRRPRRIPQLLAGMRNANLIAYDQAPRGQEHRPHVIGSAGEEVIDWIRRFVPYPIRTSLRHALKKGRAARAAPGRGRYGSSLESMGLSRRQIALLKALTNPVSETLPTQRLAELLDPPAPAQRSIHHSMKGLEDRQLVTPIRRPGGRRGGVIWRLTDRGRALIESTAPVTEEQRP